MNRKEAIEKVARIVGEACEMHSHSKEAGCVEGNDCAKCSIATRPAEKIYDVFNGAKED